MSDEQQTQSTVQSAFQSIGSECIRQYELWGEQNHVPVEWLAILTE